MAPAAKTAIVIIAHGSPTPKANAQFLACVEAYRQTRPDLCVTHSFLEHGAPDVPTAIRAAAEISETTIVVPLFLFQAGHVKTDIAAAVAAAQVDYPNRRIGITTALGGHPLLADIAHKNARDKITASQPNKTTADVMLAQSEIVFVAHGARDETANEDFIRVGKYLAERDHYVEVHPAYIGLSAPRYDDTLAQLATTTTTKRILVVPYLLFDGYYLSQLHAEADLIRQQFPALPIHIAATLGQDARLLALIDERVATA